MMRAVDSDRRVALGLFVIISSIYFATMVGVTSSNDGSHYALVRALVEHRSFEISPFLDFAEHQDYAINGERRFTDRPPGTALAAASFYALAGAAPSPIVSPPSKHDAANPRMLYAVLLSPLTGAVAVTLLYLILRRHFQRRHFSAIFVCLALALGTTLWKYGSVLYSHALSACIILLALYLILNAWQHPLSWPTAFLLGFLLGFAPLVEYTNILPSALLSVAWLLRAHPMRNHPTLIALIVGALIPISVLLIYNTLNFGSPFELSTFNVDTTLWPQNENLSSDFASPLGKGLIGLLFYGSDNQGMFLLSPITLLSVLGLVSFVHFSPQRAMLILSLFVVMLLVFAKSTTFNPGTNDGRYLTPFLSLWLIPLAFWIDEVVLSQQREVPRFAISLILFGLLFLSIHNQMLHIAYSWNHDLDVSQLKPGAVIPENVIYVWKTVFPNAGNLPLLWAGEVIVIGLGTLWSVWRTRQTHVPVAQSRA